MIRKNPIFQLTNLQAALKGRIPGQLIIQYTNRCNALCPQCSMRKTEEFERTKISDNEIRKIIEAAARQKIQALSFTGGEPFLYQEQLIALIQYASDCDIPYIRSGTNGFMFTNSNNSNYSDKIHRFAEKLSKTNLRNLWISIDSAEADTHEKMRGLKGVIQGIEKALPIFHEHGIYPAANLGINRNTGGLGRISMQMTDKDAFHEEWTEAFDHFYQFILNLGFTMVNACYPMSVDKDSSSEMSAVYGAASTNQIITFTIDEKIQLFSALMETIPKYRDKIRIFTPLVSLYSLIKQYEGDDSFSLPCRGGIDFFYIDSNDVNTYPCGYRGNENLGKFYEMDIKAIKSDAFCKACDWECFRDPSELIGHLIQMVQHPFHSLSKRKKDPVYHELWKNDITYYKKCDFFDGRKAKRF